MFEGRAPQGIILLTTFLGGMRNPDLPAKSDGALGTLVHEELTALVGATSPPVWADITRWPKAIPQYNLGHADRVRRVEDAERAIGPIHMQPETLLGTEIGQFVKWINRTGIDSPSATHHTKRS